MATNDIQLLLQKCLDGYDAGLAPEECLSAYPRVRRELEPLFRQALSLRMAYATSPRAEFRFEARERLLFAAGRDVSYALSAEPDEGFVQTTRQRLLNRAGAQTQEALRDVPPPRLPFWSNARRHLLETAATTPPKRTSGFATARVRTAVSAAVVMLAVTVAGAGFLVQSSPTSESPLTTAGAELLHLTEQVDSVEQLSASGEPIRSGLLDELANSTFRLAEQSSVDPDLKDRLPDLIERQQQLAQQLSPDTTLGETLASAQQLLEQSSESTSTTIAPTSAAAVVEPTPENTPDAVATATPEVHEEPDAAVEPSLSVQPGQVSYQPDPSVTELNLNWARVTTSSFSFVVPEGWTFSFLEFDDNGIATLPVGFIVIETDVAGAQLAVNAETGEVMLLNEDGLLLRSEGADGEVIDVPALAAAMNNAAGTSSLYVALSSLEFTAAE